MSKVTNWVKKKLFLGDKGLLQYFLVGLGTNVVFAVFFIYLIQEI